MGTGTVTVLSAAVIAEAIILAGVVTLVVRLRSHLKRAGELSTTAIDQMSELVQEAQALSETLADQLAEQVRLLAIAQRSPDSAVVRKSAGTAEASIRLRPDSADAGPEPAVAAPAPRRKKQVRAAGGRSPLMARRAQSLSRSDRPIEAEPAEEVADAAVAQRLGMDPVGVAIQRDLARQRALSAQGRLAYARATHAGNAGTEGENGR